MEKTQLQKAVPCPLRPGPGLEPAWTCDELWRYKDLIWLFVKRDFNVMYKQTVLGPAWILINPLHVHGYVLRSCSAQSPSCPQTACRRCCSIWPARPLWGFFSSCINKVSGTFTTNSNIFSKVYFPRLAMPISTMLSGLHQLPGAVRALFFCLLLVLRGAQRRGEPATGRLCRCVRSASCCRSACWALAAASSCPA